MAANLREAVAVAVHKCLFENRSAFQTADAALSALGIPLATLERLRSGVSMEVPVTTVGAAMHLARKAGASATEAGHE